MIKRPYYFSSTQEATEHLMKLFPDEMRLATPLGLGKPNLLLNSIYEKFKDDPQKKLKIMTALSLSPPRFADELAQRLFADIHQRIWGDHYPELNYYLEAQKDEIPPNIQVHEFYFQAGSALKSAHLQRHYQSVNYTHAAGNVLRADVQVIVQLVAYEDSEKGRRYSFSCNPDMTLDVVDLYKKQNKEIRVVGVLHPDLPFMPGDAEVPEDFFYGLLESSEVKGPLFALPRLPISMEDHLIGLYGSTLIEDGGTLQIGIGSLSDAIVSALVKRQNDNTRYNQVLKSLDVSQEPLTIFEKGLYGLTEMLTDGFMHLRKAGILTREVKDEASGCQTFLHGSFFLGSAEFYSWLREMPPAEKRGLRMTRVSKVNDLYDPNEVLLRQQRIKARFFNTTMQVTLLGDAMSETLPNGQVVSGVGGQYNFVAMSHELKEARSILMLRSTRVDSKGKRNSNIVWGSGHITIPRHLRDLVITEYGIADLRGKSDEECIQELLNVTDSEFQIPLLEKAKAAKKIYENYEIPEGFRQNHPESLATGFSADQKKMFLNPYALGSDFTPEEGRLVLALQKLKEDKLANPWKLIKKMLAAPVRDQKFLPELKRLGLDRPVNLKDRLYRRLVRAYLDD